jgi:hypothetical protein
LGFNENAAEERTIVILADVKNSITYILSEDFDSKFGRKIVSISNLAPFFPEISGILDECVVLGRQTLRPNLVHDLDGRSEAGLHSSGHCSEATK